MNSQPDGRQRKIDELFDELIELDLNQRKAYLDAAKLPEEIRVEVESLIHADSGVPLGTEPFQPIPAVNIAELLPDSLQPDYLLGSKLGPYEITEHIGSGGFGAVYKGVRAETFEKKVAIKIIRADRASSKEALRRFDVERQVLAELEHENIARLLDGGCTEHGLPYFVMEYINGKSITDFCDERRAAVDDRLQLFMQVCRATSHAHRFGVVHRDIKPGNILVTPEGVPKLVDFGIVKIVGSSGAMGLQNETNTDQLPLTPAYASPEQFRGQPVSVASDVYSLGIVLYELLVGVQPFSFQGLMPHELLNLVSDTEPIWPSNALMRSDTTSLPSSDTTARSCDIAARRSSSTDGLRRQLRGDLDHIVLKAVRREPHHRYESVDRLVADIENYFEGRPVDARSGTLGYLAGKFMRRHKVSVAAAVFGVLALVIGLISTLTALQSANRSAEDANRAVKNYAIANHELELMAALPEYDDGNVVDAFRRLIAIGPDSPYPEAAGWEWYYAWNRLAEATRGPMLNDAGRKILQIGRNGELVLTTGSHVMSWKLQDAILQKAPNTELKIDFASNWNTHAIDCSVEKSLLAYFDGANALTLNLANLRTGKILDTFEMPSEWIRVGDKRTFTLEFSPDGSLLASRHIGVTCLWRIDLEQKQIEPLEQIYPEHNGTRLRFSPDSRHFAMPNPHGYGIVSVWDVETRQMIWKGQHNIVHCVCWSKDNARIFSGALADGVRIWNATDGQLLEHISAVEAVTSVAVSTDNRLLAIGGMNGIVHLWDLVEKRVIASYRGHLSTVYNCEFVDSDTVLLTTDQKNGVRLWPVPGRESSITQSLGLPTHSRIRGHNDRVASIAFHPSFEFFATGSDDRTAKLWSVQDGHLIREFQLKGQGWSVSFSANGKMLGVEESLNPDTKTSFFRWWDPQTGEHIKSFEEEQHRFHKKLNVLRIQSGQSTHIANFSGMDLAPSIQLPKHPDRLSKFSFANRSASFARTYYDGKLHIFRVDGNEIRNQIEIDAHDYRMWACEFSSDDSLVATGSLDGKIKLWDTQTGNQIAQMLDHGGEVRDVAFHPNGKRLASASNDGTVMIWEVPSGKHRFTLQGAQAGMASVAFSPDGTLVAGGLDGSIFIWRAATKNDYQKRLPIAQKRFSLGGEYSAN